MSAGVEYALAAMICIGLADFVYKRAASRGVRAIHFLMVQGLFFGPAIVLYAWATSVLYTPPGFGWGMAAGFFIYIALYHFAVSLASGAVSVVAPIFRLNFVLTAAFAIVVLGEPLTVNKIIGLTAALAAVWLLLAERGAGSTEHVGRVAVGRVLLATLAIAANEGRLNRNFQGYTDDQADILLPLGPSSIGRFADGYVQNEPATGQYNAKVAAGEIPFTRGIGLTADDKMRGWVIERLMCDYSFCFSELAERFGHRSQGLVELAERIAHDDRDGFCEVSDGLFKIEPDAWPFARIIASRFDAWLELAPRQYSKAV